VDDGEQALDSGWLSPGNYIAGGRMLMMTGRIMGLLFLLIVVMAHPLPGGQESAQSPPGSEAPEPVKTMQIGGILTPEKIKTLKTIFKDGQAKRMLLGKHPLACQWISWDYFGTAEVSMDHGLLRLKGSQRSKDKKDYLTIDGVITEASQKEFSFYGTIVTKVSYLNEGQACVKTGEMTFVATGTRRYWRLKEMQNCDGVCVDYVDLFFSHIK
jgi:hypothetical protein